MKRLAIALLLALTATFAAAEDSAVVKASKASTRKKAKPRKVITNADLAKASNLPKPQPKADATLEVTAGEPVPVTADALLRARHAAEARVTVAEKRVADLERELERIEQDYYEENDPSYRDTTLAKRFAQTKEQLAAARGEATEARDVLAKLNARP